MNVSLAKYLLISISCVIAFIALKYALANLAYLKVDAYLSRWQASGTLTEAELDDALISTHNMLKLHGHHPHYLNMAAKVYEWKAYQYQEDINIVNESLLEALSLYDQSISRRYQWPLTWAYMADVKAKLGQLDNDFYTYIENAIQYGPYTKEVNLQISKLTLLYWNKLPGLPMQVGLEQIKRALSNSVSRYQLLRYSRGIGKQKVTCTVGTLAKIDDVINANICK